MTPAAVWTTKRMSSADIGATQRLLFRHSESSFPKSSQLIKSRPSGGFGRTHSDSGSIPFSDISQCRSGRHRKDVPVVLVRFGSPCRRGTMGSELQIPGPMTSTRNAPRLEVQAKTWRRPGGDVVSGCRTWTAAPRPGNGGLERKAYRVSWSADAVPPVNAVARAFPSDRHARRRQADTYLTAPRVSPAMKCRCIRKNIATGGMAATIDPADTRCQAATHCPLSE